MRLALRLITSWILALCALTAIAHAQDVRVMGDNNSVNVNGRAAGRVLVPQSPTARVAGVERAGISRVRVGVEVTRQVAVTTLDIDIANPTDRIVETEMLVPVPDGAIVRGFDFEGGAAEPTAQLLPAAEARATYDEIVSRVKDPALLEFAGHNTVRSSVFPVPAHGTQQVRLIYEHVLEADGDRVDYVLPRSESLEAGWIPWELTASIDAGGPVSALYSPTHDVEMQRTGTHQVLLTASAASLREPGPLRFSYLLEGAGVNAALYSFPDARVGGGYFLLLAGLPVEVAQEDVQPREVILVVDTSGSMSGEKLEQVRQAARSVLEGLDEGERFNLIDYQTHVATFAPRPVEKTERSLAQALDYLAALRPGGGTNLSGAVREALRQDHRAGSVPIVLFLTDGVPSVGQTAELEIAESAGELNRHARRVYTFGVGEDVNVPLLDRLADQTRGFSSYVAPREDVADAVREVFSRLHGPVLATPALNVLDTSYQPASHRVSALVPGALPDLYEDDQLLVLGQYRGEEPLVFELVGSYFGERRTFRFEFALNKPSLTNAFVPRLWADRRIGELVDHVRMAGADPATIARGPRAVHDPATRELVTEILALSTEFGILTEYTAFLALEGTDLSRPDEVLSQLDMSLLNRAQRIRVGRAALNQSINTNGARQRSRLNRRNSFLDAEMREVEVGGVQQVGDKAFFLRRGIWVDSSLLAAGPEQRPDHTVRPGAAGYRPLVTRLIEVGRQGVLAMDGDVLLAIDGQSVLIRDQRGFQVLGAATEGEG